jgi:hypothetical protein
MCLGISAVLLFEIWYPEVKRSTAIFKRWLAFQLYDILYVRFSLVFDEQFFERGILPFGYVESRAEKTWRWAF